MGQYFQVVNLDKKEKLHPHAFGDGLKLMEMASGGYGVLAWKMGYFVVFGE